MDWISDGVFKVIVVLALAFLVADAIWWNWFNNEEDY